MAEPRQVAFLIFDDMEDLDFAGPYEVFAVAARTQQPTPFAVYTVAENDAVTTRGGLRLIPHYTVHNCPPPDILLVSGGWGTRVLLDRDDLLDWIRAQAARVEHVLSVCTGALVLARAGLLDGLGATTHHSAFDLLRAEAPTAEVYEDRRYVDNGQVITSSGISAGIDMALHVVARLLGSEAAQATADYMEYRWLP